jgi:prepilin-type N-terminal cleavage/methylation domain-containing protein
MTRRSSRFQTRRGFTLIEALAAAALLGVGITAALSALGAIAKTEAAIQDKARMQRMAQEKYDEMVSTNQQALASQSGDFTDRNLPGYTWNLDVETSQVTNLDTVTVTVQKQNAGARDAEGRVEGMLYISPNSTSASATP